MADAHAVVDEARFVEQVRPCPARAQARPLTFCRDRDRDLAIGRGERLVRDDVRVGVAAPRRLRAGGKRVLGLVDERGQRRLEQRDIDALADAGTQRGQDAHRPSSPVTMSLMATPTFVGWPPASSPNPVTDIRPPTAWATKSKPGFSASGPIGP